MKGQDVDFEQLKFKADGAGGYRVAWFVHKHGLPKDDAPQLEPVVYGGPGCRSGPQDYFGIFKGKKFVVSIGIMGSSVRAEDQETANTIAGVLERYNKPFEFPQYDDREFPW